MLRAPTSRRSRVSRGCCATRISAYASSRPTDRRASTRRSARRTTNTEEAAAHGVSSRGRLRGRRGDPSNGRVARMTPRVTIGEFFRATRGILRLELLDGRRGLARSVEIPRIQKPGLALAGYLPQIHPDRIQVLGNTEISYLATLSRAAAR